jgi:Uri superfamily endonuclease
MVKRMTRKVKDMIAVLSSLGLRPVVDLDGLGSRRGCYLLALRIPGMTIRVGALGPIALRGGLYGYVGSARGSSATLARRLARHLRRRKPCHWHIDYLTTHPCIEPVAMYVSVSRALTERGLARRCARRFPAIKGFGNSDGRGAAPGHLFLLAHTYSSHQVGQGWFKAYDYTGDSGRAPGPLAANRLR